VLLDLHLVDGLLVEVAEELIREVLVLVVEEDQQHLPMLEVVVENLVHLTLKVMMEYQGLEVVPEDLVLPVA
tara:strand:+ start:113 stop:328 length:216 start_codon:yes stop_codon:yes gene_type:complete